MNSWTVGLQDPQGTINRSGRSAAGSTSEVDLIAAVTVPTGDEHHIAEWGFAVASGAAGTIFRLYGRASSADSWTQVGDMEAVVDGTASLTFGVTKKFKAGEQWRVTGQQSTAGRMAVHVHGVAKKTDERDF